MSVDFVDLYLVENRLLTSVAVDAHKPISTYFGKMIYAIVNINSSGAIAVDLNQVFNRFPGIDPTMTYYEYVTNKLTLSIANDCQTNILPQRDVMTQKYLNRVVTLDPIATEGWDIGFGNVDNGNIISDKNQISILNDLILYAPAGTNLNNLLVSVNGVFHKTQMFNNMLYVIDGFSNIKQTGQTSIVVCDTTSIGGHSIIPITRDMITLSPGDKYCCTSYIKIPSGTPFLNTSVVPVVDGYIKLFDGSYSVINSNVVSLFTNLMDIPSCFINNPLHRYKRDFFSVQNRPNPYNPSTYTPVFPPRHATVTTDEYFDVFNTATTIDASLFHDETFIKTRLSSAHSFLIVLNNPNVFLNQYQLINHKEPHIFECFSTDTPRGILIYNKGKVLPYTITSNKSTGQHVLYLTNLESTTDLFETGFNDPTVPSGRADYNDLTEVKPAFLYDIFSSSLTV